MKPLQFWLGLFIVAAAFGTFWFEVAVGVWLSLIGIGLAAGLGAIVLIGDHQRM